MAVALDIYRKKRKFGVTAEPRGRKGHSGGHRYVIQKHAATRLHYDLRLELDGVMKSWAVTRGPSLDPNDKRLAVHVEDHPIEYNSFEGTIPKGEYGGGTVMIWDRGSWTPEGDPHYGYGKGHLVFDLHGEKLHGRWHLVRMRARDRERHENWLLIKAKDAEARGARDGDILEQEPNSAVTGRSIDEIAAGKGNKRVWHSNRAARPGTKAAFRRKIQALAAETEARPVQKDSRGARNPKRAANGKRSAKKSGRSGQADLPDFVPLSLATLYEQPPRGPDWLHEIKFDGYRTEARLDHGRVKLLTRKQQDWTHRFKPVAEAVAALAAETALLDGEIVVEGENGISDFSLLQIDLKDGRSDRFVYYVFDLLHLNGRDLTGEPLDARKAALAGLLKRNGKDGVIRYAEHFDEDGPLIYRHACDMGLEGIVSKRREAPYRSGRADNFIKTKCRNRQELIVAGFSPSTAMPNAIGALTVAVRDNGELRYAGRVGTGYTQKTARDLWKRLDPLRAEKRPFALPADERRKDVIWVKPKIVIDAEFAGFTHGGVLRQASFKGVREDKSADEVVREVAVTKKPPASPAGRSSRGRAGNTTTNGKTKNGRGAKQSGSAKQGGSAGALHLTHPDRVYWPDAGVTKKDLAAYYVSVWDWIRPHILGRALSLVRAPEGISGETFFQKHIGANVKSSPLRHAVPGKDHDVIAIETLDDLIALVQSGTLEIHVRGSRLESLETCDRIVFDLDPGEGVSWPQIVAAARETRERLKAENLESFVKLSGGKGIHVVVPIADADWDTAKMFAQRIAARMAAENPKLYLAKMTKALRQGRIFIDYFRNSREATSVAPYSTRARPGAPVSAPVTWERLSRTTGGNDFSMLDLKKRLKDDAWAEIGKVRQRLPAAGKTPGKTPGKTRR
ncbi:MAG: DNA ligase D [Hyphomicrobiales bacterium]|nr:DNA ligase D [Hyphomicrobiales bacterium]